MRRLLVAAALALLVVAVGAPAGADAAGGAGQDQVSFGTDITIGAGQTVDRDIFCFGCSVTVEGAVVRDVTVIGGAATINGSVGRDVFVLGGDLALGARADVSRDATVVGGSLERAPGAHVGRDALSSGVWQWRGAHRFFPIKGAPYVSVAQVVPGLLLLALAALLAVSFPRQLGAGSEMVDRSPASAFGFGCLGIIAAFLLAGLLAVTVILSPASLAIGLLVLAGWVFGWAAIFAAAGRRVLSPGGQPAGILLAVTVGGLLFLVALMVPVLNLLVFMLGGSMALGAALATRFGTRIPGTPLWPWRGGRAAAGGWLPAQPPSPPPPPA